MENVRNKIIIKNVGEKTRGLYLKKIKTKGLYFVVEQNPIMSS